MSYTEIYAIHKNGDVRLYEENKNSWRWSPQIWGELEERHLPVLRPRFVPSYIEDDQVEEYLGYKPKRHGPDDLKEVWNLFNTDKVTTTERWVLGSTYDNVIVMKEDFEDLIRAYRSFYQEENGTSLLELADIYEKMQKDDDIIGVAWSISLIGNPWLDTEWVDESHPDFDEYNVYDEEDGLAQIDVPYNIFESEKKHWVLTKILAETGKEE